MHRLAFLGLAACWTGSSSPDPVEPTPAEPAPIKVAEEPRAPHHPRIEPTEPSNTCDQVACLLDPLQPCCSHPSHPHPIPHPTPGPGPQSTPEFLDRNMIASAIGNVKIDLMHCGDNSATKGTVKVRVRVDPRGTVADVTIDMPAPDPALETCLAGVIRRARFTVTQKGGSFVYPFVF